MSVSFSIENLTNNQKLKIENELTIKPIITSKNPFKKQSKFDFGKQNLVVELYNVYESTKTVDVPFAFAFHNLVQGFPNDHKIFEKIDYKFVGNLLERQKEIKEETFEILNRNRSILLSLYTGFGKTIYAIYLLSKIKLKTVILCHRKIIIDQWLKAIQKYIPDSKVCILEGNKIIMSDYDIYIINVVNVPKKDKKDYSHIGLVIIDESHTICTESYSKSLFYFEPKYMIALSATPFRTDGMDTIMEMFIGPEMISRKMNRLFNVYKYFTKFEPKVETNAQGDLNWNSVLESQASDSYRNYLICSIISYFKARNILVLVKRKDHALKLKEMLQKANEDVDVFMGSQKECNYSCRILVATYSKSGTGFDHPSLNMMITAADVEENFVQYLGRIFRTVDEFPIYIDLVDKFKPMYNHSTTRINLCKELGGIVKKYNDYFPDLI